MNRIQITETGRLAGCVTEDHKVLTPNGWVSITNFPPIIAQWQSDKPIEFVAVNRWVGKRYCGRMVEVQNKNVSLIMTEDHRVVLSTPNSHSIVSAILLWDGHSKRSLRLPSGQQGKYHTITRADTNFFDVERTKVYCPTVPSGMFHICLDGKQCVTGSSNDWFIRPEL